MPALASEPWRGRTHLVVAEALTTMTVRADFDGGLSSTGNASTWQGAPGDGMTLTMSVSHDGNLTNPYQQVTVEAFLPGGASLGTTSWQPTIWANGTSATPFASRSFRFDANPLDGLVGAARSGMIELVITLTRSGQATNNHTINSRGETTGSTPAGTTFSWARGYARAHNSLTAFSTSRVSAGGAATTDLAYGDSVFSRATFLAPWFSAPTHTFRHTRSGDTATARSVAQTFSGNVADFTFSGTGSSSSRRVDPVQTTDRYKVAADPIGAAIDVPQDRFGGSNDFIFQLFADVATGWVSSAGVTIGQSSLGVTVDPRVTVVSHLQANDNAFGTPPSSKLIVTRQRQTSDLGFVAVRVTNARGEGQNNVSYTYSLRDTAGLVSAKTASGSTATQGGETGWGALMSWDAALPGGSWTNTVGLSDASGTLVAADTTSVFALLASDPRIVVVTGGGASGGKNSHFVAGEVFLCGMAPLRVDLGQAVGAIPMTTLTEPKVALTRFNPILGRAEFFNGTAWVALGSGNATFFNCFTPQQLGLGTEAFAYIATFGPSGAVYTTSTASWEFDVFVVGSIKVNGTPYGNYIQTPSVGAANSHARFSFDPTGLFA